MNRDPEYYLQKADYFYNLAQNNGHTPLRDKPYEYVVEPADPVERMVEYQPPAKRFFDPVTRHYYKINDDGEYPVSNSYNNNVLKNADVWFPENKLSYRYVRDPATGKYYRVEKNYDADGNYSYTTKRRVYAPKKAPGTNFYQPNYRGI